MESGIFAGLRGRLYPVILSVFVPMFGLTVFAACENHQKEIGIAKSNAAALVGVMAAEQNRTIAAAQQLLLGLSRLHEVRDPDAAAACSFLVWQLVRIQPQYYNLGVIPPGRWA